MTTAAQKMAHHLSQPENRIRYSLSFVDGVMAIEDETFREQAMIAALYWIGQAADEEAHF